MHRQSYMRRFSSKGGSLVLVLVCTMVGGFGLTCWISLLATRLRQADTNKQATARRLTGLYASGMTQQYAYNFKFRHQVARQLAVSYIDGLTEGSAVLNGFKLTSQPFGIYASNVESPGLETFTSTAAITKFNNVTRGQTAGSRYDETLSMFSLRSYEAPYSFSNPKNLGDLKILSNLVSYPRSLLGDLLTVYASDSGSSYNVASCLNVAGRVIIQDGTANVASVKATGVLNMTKTALNTTLNSAGSASLMPPNFPAYPIFNDGGKEGDGARAAQLDGSLNMIDNSNFTPGSISHIMRYNSEGNEDGTKWVECTTFASGTSTSSSALGTTPAKVRTGYYNSTTPANSIGYYPNSTTFYIVGQPIYRTNTGTPGNGLLTNSTTTTGNTAALRPSFTPLPSSSSGGYRTTTVDTSSTGRLYTLNIRLKNLDRHVRVTGGAEQVIIEGSSTQTDYADRADGTGWKLTPVIIWLDSATVRDVCFVGECPRPIVLVSGTGTSSTSISYRWMTAANITGTPTTANLDWRIHFINQNRAIYLYPYTGSSLLHVNLYGGIRTNWTFVGGTGYTSATSRFFLNQESDSTNAANLLTVLPRDGWLDTILDQ